VFDVWVVDVADPVLVVKVLVVDVSVFDVLVTVVVVWEILVVELSVTVTDDIVVGVVLVVH
jgi:hypothetical protein